MPAKVIAEKIGLSQNRINSVLKSLSSREFDTPVEILRKCKALINQTLVVKNSIDKMIDSGQDLLNVPYVKRKLAEKDGINLTYH